MQEREVEISRKYGIITLGGDTMRNFERSVKISDRRIADALQKMHDETGIPKATYIKQAIAEKLNHMDVRPMTIAEIEVIERDGLDTDSI